MLLIKGIIILCIVLSAILAFFSSCLLFSLVTKEQNFIFTQTIANIGSEKSLLKAGSGMIFGSSFFLAICLIPLFTNYNCGFARGYISTCEFQEKDKPQQYNYNREESASARMLEALIGLLISFIFVGLILYSIDFFHIYNDEKLINRDIYFLWSIFSLSLGVFLLITFLFLKLLVLEKPSDLKGGKKYEDTKENNERKNLTGAREKRYKKALSMAKNFIENPDQSETIFWDNIKPYIEPRDQKRFLKDYKNLKNCLKFFNFYDLL